MQAATLIYPHQLFPPQSLEDGAKLFILIEDPLLFSQYRFHRQKRILHRASMKSYAALLSRMGKTVHYIEASQLPTTQSVADHLVKWKVKAARVVDPCDDWLTRRLTAAIAARGIALSVMDDPHFLTSRKSINQFAANKKKLFFTDFYIEQRKRLDILLEDNKPAGGKWSFDPENRKRLPRSANVPAVSFPPESEFVQEARRYVRTNFPDASGDDADFHYPIDHEAATHWLNEFIAHRLRHFGDYEDAISREHDILHHSVLTPMLNIGLLSPRQVVDAALAHGDRVPLNSLEGFIRQVIGWREFVRLVYLTHGRAQRTRNFWKHDRKMPAAFYDGTTGIEPIDHVIRQVLRTGYCHHIERLMLLGNFMLLCDIHPDAVYQWFMELFIDAYDWVMVPNVYGMSQHADGGLMTTKPYISGSSYVLKMSDFKKGPWCPIWDALYWRFIDRHADFFASNPRMAMMVRLKQILGDKMQEHHRVADAFLAKLHA